MQNQREREGNNVLLEYDTHCAMCWNKRLAVVSPAGASVSSWLEAPSL